MSTTVTLQAPSTMNGATYYDRNGVAYSIPATGLVALPLTSVLDAIAAGFTLTDASIAAAAAVAISKIATLLGDRVLSSPGLAITANTKLGTDQFYYQIGAASGGVNTYKTSVLDKTTGFALAAGTVAADMWGIWLAIVAADGTRTTLAGAGNVAGYADEASAIAALPAASAAHAAVGYVTVKTASGQPFVPGTDALKSGTGGNVASQTNYYNAGLGF